jgi:RIO-like serine/threonine protein kinase
LRKQLSQTLDDNIEPLWKQGARGIMFKVTLGVYGYTVIAKGTVLAFMRDLQHEAVVYRRLQHLQGVYVPVFLGSVDLDRPYYYDLRTHVIHMMFLSWGGERMSESSLTENIRQERSQELVRSVHAIHSMGVVHGDIREPNVLWNSETGRVVVIDFERAVLLDLPRTLLSSSQPNRKRKRSFGKEMRLGPEMDAHFDRIHAETLIARAVLG